MAVFSIVKLSELEGAKRLDAEYYKPEYLEVIEKIKKLPHKKLGDLCLKITDGSHQTPPYQESGIPFLMVKNVLEQQINFDQDISFISEDFDKKLGDCSFYSIQASVQNLL
jgi:type I restriction enzyme S subunit